MTRDEAFEKIRKLLNRNGRTDAEGDTASIIAAALAEKHGIDLQDVERAENREVFQITHKIIRQWIRVPDEATYASIICKKFFEVSPIHRGMLFEEQMVFVGTAHHIQIAEYVFDFLLGEFRRCWNRRSSKRIKCRKKFLYGVFVGLYSKLSERFAAPPKDTVELEISWSAKRQKYIEENFGAIEQSKIAPKRDGGAAARQGYRDGQQIEIRDGLESSPESTQGQLPAVIQRRLLGA